MDKKIVLMIFNLTKKNQFINEIFKIITNFSYYLFFFIYILGAIYLIFKNKNILFSYIFAPLTSILISFFIKNILKKNRPFYELGLPNYINYKAIGSFPSNHAVSSMIIALSISSFCPNLKFFLMAIAVLTGVSRIMIFVHYPSDILFGWIVAFLVFCIYF